MGQWISTGDSAEAIVPARGRTPWLTASLASIAVQTLPAAAVTVVDDGLEYPAAVQALGQEFFGGKFRLLKNSGHGISAALNTGIQQSSARWIMRMDADDLAHPQRLKKQLDFLMAQPDNVIGCGTQVRFINAGGKVVGYSRLPTSWHQIVGQVYSRTSFVHPSLVIRRDVLLTTPYRSTMDGAEDVDLVLRLVEKGRLVNLDEALLDYRLYDTQESFRSRARHTAIQELAFRLARAREKTNVDPLDDTPELGDNFIRWRLSDPVYIKTRCFLTATRYMATYLRGHDLEGFFRMALMSLKLFPTNSSSLRLSWLVARNAGAALMEQTTPFAELNS